ncbi:MAG: response regulator [Psychrobium sp.]|nr:response regulator [Psychrobium sp.]
MSSAMSVLVVDDSRLTRMIITKIISEHFTDWNISHAENAATALQLVKSKKFDFISLDHNMPDQTGFEILGELIESQPDAKIGVFTANVQKALRKRFEEQGAKFYGKPVTEDMILEFIQQEA